MKIRPVRGATTRGRPRRAVALAAGATALAFGLTAISTSAASAAVAAAPSGIDRVVSLSGTIDSTCGSGIPSGTPVYTSVQAAVTAASGGQQIYVCAGTYTENVNIATNDIDLLGPNWNDPTGSSDAARIVAASASSPVINFASTSTNNNGVRGLTLQGGTYGVRTQATGGCCWTDANTEGIRNNVITGSSVSGIETNGLDGPALISGNKITPAAGGDGIRTYNAVGALDIQSNTISLSGNGVGITIGGNDEQGSQTVGGSSASLGNKITGGKTGILVIDTTPGGLLVDANTLRFNDISGTSGDGILLDGTLANTSIYDNKVADAGGSGVHITNPSSVATANDIRLQRNTITSPAVDGVTVDGYVSSINVGSTIAADGNTILDAGNNGVTVTGVVVSPGAQFVRNLSAGVINIYHTTITNPANAGIDLKNVENATVSSNTISGAGGDGVTASVLDLLTSDGNTITGSGGDGYHASDVANGAIRSSTITGNAGDGIELTNNTSAMNVSLNTVNNNAAGIRVTSPTVRALSNITDNNVAFNTGYGCEDQSSGVISNPPASGTQGNDWTTTNTGAALQSPPGICGASMTAAGPIPDGVVGTAYSTPMSATGAPGPYTYYAAGLPAGLSINSGTGVISGTPTTAINETPVTVWVVSAGGVWGQYSEPVTISGASSFTASGTLADGTLNTPYTSTAPTVSGGTGPYTWSASGLPAGLSIDPSTGVVSGTPTVAVANQSVTFTVTDANGNTATFTTTITILPDDPGVPMSNPLVAGAGLSLVVLGMFAVRRRRRVMA